MVMRGIELIVRNRSIHTDAEVRGKFPHKTQKGPAGFRVGLKFYRISEEEVDFLATYIAEYAIQYQLSD